MSPVALADEGELYRTPNVSIVYSVTEPQPKQYQLYIHSRQLTDDSSCAVFTANVRTVAGVDHRNGVVNGVASFMLEPTDFPLRVWLSDVRVESWAAWQAQNAKLGREGYGNPCTETKSITSSPAKNVSLPANPSMPCDSVALNIAGVRAVQHLTVDADSVRIEITQPDSNLVYTAKLVDIRQDSFHLENGALTFTVAAGTVESLDRKGNHFRNAVTALQLVCKTAGDAEVLRDRLLGRSTIPSVITFK